MSDAPLTLGTAGHVDHGKTSLVAALTGVDTDRLPEEKARGLTIALGYAPLALRDGRQISVVDVPGHERFVRTMVAGATGVDMYLMAIAADDGVMPQTREHAAVLRALGVAHGVVAITKSELGEPERARREAAALLPEAIIVACSAHRATGLSELVDAIAEVAGQVRSRATSPGPPLLHVDRAFTIRGRGTVVTGTLWAGRLARGDLLELLPGSRRVRVRALQVHGQQTEPVSAGQRVAVNLAGVRAEHVSVGEVLTLPGAVCESAVLDCALQLRDARHAERVQVHHGTRSVTGRLSHLEDDLWQLRLERGVLARDGDRVVVRRLAPPDTLGGGRILDARAGRRGRRDELLSRLRALRDGQPPPGRTPPATRRPAERSHDPGGRSPSRRSGEPPARELQALERRLLDAGTAMISEPQLGDDRRLLGALRARGAAVRVSGRLYAHSAVAEATQTALLDLLASRESVTIAEARDALGLSRKSAQAFLEHLDAMRLTRRAPDDRRVLSRSGLERAREHTGGPAGAPRGPGSRAEIAPIGTATSAR